ncbi:uncharacterized protein [Nicotiana sylvestris]|uniref:uncharacterized protein isoform X2 n=1 Tax=Nicotiana sylvestris TaxID=4096 RepID=UPI00388CA778
MAARIALLKYLRVEARPAQLRNPRLIGGSFSQLFRRQFSDEVRGSFLDKDEVRDRVINVVKNCQKVDPSKKPDLQASKLRVRTSFLSSDIGMARTRNSDTDTQDASQETIATIVAQGRTKKASTQKRRGKSAKGVQVPRVEQEEGVEHDDPVPQDPVLPPTAAPAQATISLEVGQMFNAVNSAMEMFKASMANQNERRDEIPPQSNRQSNSESSRVNEFLKLSPPVFHGSIVDEDPMLWLEGVKKAFRVMKAFDDEAVELAAYQLRDVAGAWFEMWEKERDEDDGPPTWEEFEEAFMANFIPEEDREAKATEFEQLKQGNKSVQEYYMEFIRLAKHAPHMVKTEKAKIRRFVGGLAYHIKDTTSAAAVGMEAFSSVVGFAKHLEKDRQLKREEKELNKKARTTCRCHGTSSGGGRDPSKESLAPAQFSHQSGCPKSSLPK